MARLRVEFKHVEHGWLQTLFYVEEEEHECWFSYVYSDALPSLCTTLGELKNTSQNLVVIWMCEPEEHEMHFSKEGDHFKFEMWRFEDHKRVLGQEPYLEFSILGTYEEICLPFWRALRSLQGRYSEEEFKERWRYSFPTQKLAMLTQQLGKG